MTRMIRRLGVVFVTSCLVSGCLADIDLHGCPKDSCSECGYSCEGNVGGLCVDYEGDPCVYRHLVSPVDCP